MNEQGRAVGVATELAEGTLTAYVERVLALQARQQAMLTPADLDAVAQDLGLTPADQELVRREATAVLQRGRGFLEVGRFDDALGDLQHATALSPHLPEAWFALGLAHALRWKRFRRGADREAAELCVRRCLTLDPGHSPSYNLLNQLDHPTRRNPATSPAVVAAAWPPAPVRADASSNWSLALLVTALGTLVLGVLLAVGFALYMTLGVVEPTEPALPPAVEATTEPSPAAQDQADKLGETVPADRTELPLQLVPTAEAPGVELLRLRSLVHRGPTEAWFELEGRLHNGGTTELHRRRLRVELRDDAGTGVATEVLDLNRAGAPPLRPGDIQPFALRTRIDPRVVSASLNPELSDLRPAATRYGMARELPIRWTFDQPPQFGLSIRERTSSFLPTRSGGGYGRATLEVTNTGEVAYGRLKLRIRYLDRSGAVVSTDETYVSTGRPPFLPGETWLKEIIENVPESFAAYDVEVLAAQ